MFSSPGSGKMVDIEIQVAVQPQMRKRGEDTRGKGAKPSEATESWQYANR